LIPPRQRLQLDVPIIYMLLWFEYNYRHALELSKVPRWRKPFFNDHRICSLYSQEHLTFYELSRCIVVVVFSYSNNISLDQRNKWNPNGVLPQNHNIGW